MLECLKMCSDIKNWVGVGADITVQFSNIRWNCSDSFFYKFVPLFRNQKLVHRDKVAFNIMLIDSDDDDDGDEDAFLFFSYRFGTLPDRSVSGVLLMPITATLTVGFPLCLSVPACFDCD